LPGPHATHPPGAGPTTVRAASWDWGDTYCDPDQPCQTECDCALDTYVTRGLPAIREALRQATSSTMNTWACRVRSRFRGVHDGLDLGYVTGLQEIVSAAGFGNREWNAVTLTWDGETLAAEVTVATTTNWVTLTRLDLAQQSLYQRWREHEPLRSTLAASVLRSDRACLEQALEVADRVTGPGAGPCHIDIDELVSALTQLTPATRDALDVDLLVGLARDWTGTMHDLIAAATAMATEPERHH